MKRSSVLSVYDSDPDAERSPFTFALVVPQQLTLSRLIDLLHLRADCHPPDLRNHCSLWFGRMPISESSVINVHMGHAFRLLVARGVRFEISQLLDMSHSRLREVLQSSMRHDIFIRPPDPSFLHSPDGTDFPALHDVDMSPDTRPEWISVLQRHFNFHHVFEDLEEGPVLYGQVWYLNAHPDFHCDHPRRVRLQEDPLSWRTDLIFSWRDRLLRAMPSDIRVLHAPLSSSEHPSPEVQMIIAQGLPTNNCAVIITLFGNTVLQLRWRRLAHVFISRVSVREVLRMTTR